jgi:8-oxo-dGTP pyrophosphatase MutT (NUDIX family)
MVVRADDVMSLQAKDNVTEPFLLKDSVRSSELKRRSGESLSPVEIDQAGALCYRQRGKDGLVEVLLVESLRSGRWGLPKGHIERGETTSVAAEREAFEEAGVQGKVNSAIFGTFTYAKDSNARRLNVSVHLLGVEHIAAEYPEKRIRKSKWFPIEAAIKEVGQPGLSETLRKFRLLGRVQNGTA